MLDAAAYPHILDAVFRYAPHNSLLALRGASRSFKRRVDGVLSYSITILACADASPALQIRTPSRSRLPLLLDWETRAEPAALRALSPSVVDIHLSHPISPGVEAAFAAIKSLSPRIVRYRGSVQNYRPVDGALSIGTAMLENPNMDSLSERESESSEERECETLMTYTCDVGAPASPADHVIGVQFHPGHVHLPDAWIGGLGHVHVPNVTVVFVPGGEATRCSCRPTRQHGTLGGLSSLRMVQFAPRGAVRHLTLVNVREMGWGGIPETELDPPSEDAAIGDQVRDLFRSEMRRRRDARVPPFRGWINKDIDAAVQGITLLSLDEWRDVVGDEVVACATDWAGAPVRPDRLP